MIVFYLQIMFTNCIKSDRFIVFDFPHYLKKHVSTAHLRNESVFLCMARKYRFCSGMVGK